MNKLCQKLIVVALIFLLSGCNTSGNTANKIIESIQEKNYSTAGRIYEEAIQEVSDEKKESIDEAVSASIIEFLDESYKSIESDSSKRASFTNSLSKIKEMDIDNKALTEKIESYTGGNTESVENIKEQQNSNTIFNMNWNTFKDEWYASFIPDNSDLSAITDTEEEEIYQSLRHNAKINDSLYICANTDLNSMKIMSVVVIGNVEGEMDVFTASANLIKIADPSLALETRKQIALEYLGLNNGIIENEKVLSYTHNGIKYTAEYDDNTGSLPILTVTVEKEFPFSS